MMNSSEIMSVTQLLGWKDVSTKRQRKNGTLIYELPIKVGRGNTNIKVGSFQSGYVRRQNGCYTPYQINKRPAKTVYCKDFKTHYGDDGDYTRKWTGKYNKYTVNPCVLMMDEVERLNYLISYCLKNYYIGYANQVADGKFIPKWEHEWKLKQERNNRCEEVADFQHESGDRIKDLEEKLENMIDAKKYYQNHYEKLKEGVVPKWKYDEAMKLGLEQEKELSLDPIQNLSVTVNGARYKII